MSKEAPVAVITDSTCSIRPEEKLAQEYGVKILPINIIFKENGQEISYDETKLPLSEFYAKLAAAKELPTTSGSVIGPAEQTYRELGKQGRAIVSVHITARHSGVYNSAITAAKNIHEENPQLQIDIIDSKTISLGTWMVARTCAQLAQEQAPFEDVLAEGIRVADRIGLIAYLVTLENAVQGGRIPAWQGLVSDLLRLKHIVEIPPNSGEIKRRPDKRFRTSNQAQSFLAETVQDQGDLTQLAVIHTNAPEAAQDMKGLLQEFYPGEIMVRDAGATLAVHAAEGAVGVVFQKA
jgi:DegV family protein with EDD domain